MCMPADQLSTAVLSLVSAPSQHEIGLSDPSEVSAEAVGEEVMCPKSLAEPTNGQRIPRAQNTETR